MCKVLNCPNHGYSEHVINSGYCESCAYWNSHARWYNRMKDKEEEEKKKNDEESVL